MTLENENETLFRALEGAIVIMWRFVVPLSFMYACLYGLLEERRRRKQRVQSALSKLELSDLGRRYLNELETTRFCGCLNRSIGSVDQLRKNSFSMMDEDDQQKLQTLIDQWHPNELQRSAIESGIGRQGRQTLANNNMTTIKDLQDLPQDEKDQLTRQMSQVTKDKVQDLATPRSPGRSSSGPGLFGSIRSWGSKKKAANLNEGLLASRNSQW
eukprot:COSAG05_NODE_673_length_7989_cov_2.973638_5_plen_214_part_00